MEQEFKPKYALTVTNTLTREKEKFESLTPGYVGMYVCGPTVYNEVHLGNCRTFFSFDLVYRYLMYLGYKVRYVRNITDVGHLVDDAEEGEGKIEKQARLEQLEPMEIVQKYTNGFHDVMRQLNALPPSIEPTATGHLIEQIEMVKTIIENGYAYEMNGSVYFDTQKLVKEGTDVYNYGTLSGKKQDDLLTETRDDLKSQSEKRHSSDFAIWMKADENHIMKWPSPWSMGFPGWHLECSAMSTKYLGKYFDVHGGGMDLQFPHHENEVAQNVGACGCQPVKYWLHTNMLVLNGKKMSKSKGNSILPAELFTGENDILTQAYSPMSVRFFMLQAHYASTLNITDKGLQDAEKGYLRLMEAYTYIKNIEYPSAETITKEDTKLKAALSSLTKNINLIKFVLDSNFPEEDLEKNKKIFIDSSKAIFAAMDHIANTLKQIKNQQNNFNNSPNGKNNFFYMDKIESSTFSEIKRALGVPDVKLDNDSLLSKLPFILLNIDSLDYKELGFSAKDYAPLKGRAISYYKDKVLEIKKVLDEIISPQGDRELNFDYMVNEHIDQAFAAMNDDFNTPKALAHIFNLVSKINSIKNKQLGINSLSKQTFIRLKQSFYDFIFEILGLLDESAKEEGSNLTDEAMNVIIELRQEARTNKDWATSDVIRDKLQKIGIQIKDSKEGASWIKH